jgi:hypothetical protein
MLTTEAANPRLPHRRHRRLIHRELWEAGRVAGRQQHPIALAQRNFEFFGEQQDHLGARP